MSFIPLPDLYLRLVFHGQGEEFPLPAPHSRALPVRMSSINLDLGKVLEDGTAGRLTVCTNGCQNKK